MAAERQIWTWSPCLKVQRGKIIISEVELMNAPRTVIYWTIDLIPTNGR